MAWLVFDPTKVLSLPIGSAFFPHVVDADRGFIIIISHPQDLNIFVY